MLVTDTVCTTLLVPITWSSKTKRSGVCSERAYGNRDCPYPAAHEPGPPGALVVMRRVAVAVPGSRCEDDTDAAFAARRNRRFYVRVLALRMAARAGNAPTTPRAARCGVCRVTEVFGDRPQLRVPGSSPTRRDRSD